MLISESLLRNIIKNSISKKMLQRLSEAGGNPGASTLSPKEFEKSNSKTLSKSQTVGKKVGQIQTIEQIPKDGKLSYVDPLVGGLIKLNVITKHMRIVKGFSEYAEFATMTLSRNTKSAEGDTKLDRNVNSKELLFFQNGNWTPNFTEVFTKIIQQGGFINFWKNLANSTGGGTVELKNVLLFYCYFSGMDLSNLNQSIQQLGQSASITFDNIGILDRVNEASGHEKSGAADLFIKGLGGAKGDLKSFLDSASDEVTDSAMNLRTKFKGRGELADFYKYGKSDEPRNFQRADEKPLRDSITQNSAYNTNSYDDNFDQEIEQLRKDKEARQKLRAANDDSNTGSKTLKKMMKVFGYKTPDEIEDEAYDQSINDRMLRKEDNQTGNFRRNFMKGLFQSLDSSERTNINIKAVEAFIRDFVAGFANFCRLIVIFKEEYETFGYQNFNALLTSEGVTVQNLVVEVMFKGYDLVTIEGVSKFINTSYYEFSASETEGISETIKEKFKYEVKKPKKPTKKAPKKAVPTKCLVPAVEKLNNNPVIVNIAASFFGNSNAQVNTGNTTGKNAKGGNVSNQGTVNKGK